MAKTPITAAMRWTGEAFDVPEMSYWLIVSIGSGAITFNGENLAVETPGGPVSAAPGDWVLLDGADLGVADDQDFRDNYEVIDA